MSRTYLQDLEQRRTRRREQTRRNVYNYRCKVTGKRNQLKATSHEVRWLDAVKEVETALGRRNGEGASKRKVWHPNCV